jgi:hypothetical protein
MVCVPGNLPALVAGQARELNADGARFAVALSRFGSPWLENAHGQPDSFGWSHLDSREDTLKHAALAMLAVCLVALSGGHARADYTVVEVNFILADKDGDLLLSKTEYLLVPLEAFAKLDANGNNALDADELGDLAKNAEFGDGDSDKSGNLSLEEIISEKLADFEAADTNKDGALNVDEVTVFEAKKSDWK